MMTVTEQLRQNGELENVGGAVHITELTARVYSAANIEYHAKIIAQKYLARRLISFASKIEADAFGESNDVDDLLQAAEGQLLRSPRLTLREKSHRSTGHQPCHRTDTDSRQCRKRSLRTSDRIPRSRQDDFRDGRRQTLSSSPHVRQWVRPRLCSRWQKHVGRLQHSDCHIHP